MLVFMPRFVAVFLLACSLLSAQQTDLAAKVRRGNQLMAAGKFSEAADLYAGVAKALPGDPGILTNLGMAYHMAGKDRLAIREFRAALKIQPGIMPALLMMGASYLRIGQPEKALAPLREVLRAQPEMKEVRELLAQACSDSGRYEEALTHFRWLTTADASAPKGWYGLGRSYEELAKRALANLEKTAPESGYMVALVASVQEAQGHNGSAFHLYREALSRKPDLVDVHKALARIYRKTGHPDWAAQEDKKQSAVPRPDCKAHPLACDFLAGRYRKVVRAANRLRTAEAWYWQSRAYSELGRQAFARLEKLPPSVEGHALMARMHRDNMRYAESVKEWRAALKMLPGNPGLEKELAISLRLNEDYDNARPLAEKLLKQNPGSAELNYLLGQILLNQRLPAKAIPYLEKAVRLAPGFLPAKGSLGLAYLENKQQQKAISLLEEALPTDPDGSLHFRLARAYQANGQKEQAKKMLVEYQKLRKSGQAGPGGKPLEILPPE